MLQDCCRIQKYYYLCGIINLFKYKIMKKYIIRPEVMGGKTYYMIYMVRFFIFSSFLERWNSYKSAKKRINELKLN